MSNAYYCDYKTKYRSKVETLDTHCWCGQHIPMDKTSNQHQETQVLISISTIQLLSDSRETTLVSTSKVNTITFKEGDKITSKMV